MSLSLLLFRRDLRLADNTALLSALQTTNKIIPCFIFDPRQVEDHSYKSLHALQFMMDSIQDLKQQIADKKGRLYLFYGAPHEILLDIIKNTPIKEIYVNKDYTPFSQKRDSLIETLCKKNNILFSSHHDALLNEPGKIQNQNGEPYKVYSAFLKKSRLTPVSQPVNEQNINFYTKDMAGVISIEEVVQKICYAPNPHIFAKGGRSEALEIIGNLKKYVHYKEERNFPFLNATTGLSAHNKFGTLSIREVFHHTKDQLGEFHTIINELYWRDFFTHIAFHNPQIFGNCFHQKYDNLLWENDSNLFDRWREAKTGFPIVDAGMNELNQTGYMHNRVRMIVASFLTKHLHIDWRWGEKYFAQKLIDYDPCVNNGNWQWAASTGCDAQPYFRIFNPWLQQKKFDAKAMYIKKWIADLENVNYSDIHTWHKENVRQKNITNYPCPIIEHSTEVKKAKAMFLTIK